MSKKAEFESPISRFIRLYCSLCPYWTELCHFGSESGRDAMNTCMHAKLLDLQGAE